MTTVVGQINKTINSIISAYNKASIWGKMLTFVTLFFLLVISFRRFTIFKEGFEQNEQFVFKSGTDLYDKFYADVYDYLVFNNMKDEFEVGELVNKTSPTSQSIILDIGCGTGHHVSQLADKGFNITGLDISPAMIAKAKELYPQGNYKVGDALVQGEFNPNSFTHILSMYFTVYYFQDKRQFFNNCFQWLMPGGYLVVHLVDRKHFDPILPPGNPLLFVSPQKYAKERITSTKVKFDDFAYSAKFDLNEESGIAKFTEKFKNDNNGYIRKQEHIMYMPDTQQIIDEAQGCGFILEGKIDLLQCQYEYQYLYIFVKPN
uniref:Methyltransferase type 11 domain-containing protein n=1 Tax=viral metagenome TaxID=1070528 RepID=A0A6C0IS48_9ZZZZ